MLLLLLLCVGPGTGIARYVGQEKGCVPHNPTMPIMSAMPHTVLCCAVLQGRPSGRVLVYCPSSRTTAVVAEGLWFANGVALAGDESFLVVAETFGCRLKRHWLKGPKAGTTEVRCW